MSAFKRALPSAEGLDFSQISAAVGAVIFGNSTTGLLKNMSLSGDVDGFLARKTDRNHTTPLAQTGGCIVQCRRGGNFATGRTGLPGIGRYRNTRHRSQYS